eukprot:3706292-Prymnesium_polylepis.1
MLSGARACGQRGVTGEPAQHTGAGLERGVLERRAARRASRRGPRGDAEPRANGVREPARPAELAAQQCLHAAGCAPLPVAQRREGEQAANARGAAPRHAAVARGAHQAEPRDREQR